MDFNEVERLVLKAKLGCGESKGKIVESFKPYVITQAKKYRIPSYDFEDLLNEGYGAILKSIDVYSPNRGCFTSFCNITVQNTFKVLLRNSMIRDSRVEYCDVIDEREDFEGSALDGILKGELSNLIRGAMSKLNDEEMELVSFVYFKGNSLQAFANNKGLPYSRARGKKNSVLKKCRVFMNDCNYNISI